VTGGCAFSSPDEVEEEGTYAGELVGQSGPYMVPHSVIAHYFPQSVWFGNSEACAAPTTSSGNTGVALYSVRPHPDQPSAALVSLDLVYKQDCGHLIPGGFDNHLGDIESMYMTLSRDSLCSTGWRLNEFKTVAHGGNPSNHEVGSTTRDSCDPVPEVFATPQKHALYLTISDANLRVPAEFPSRGWRGSFSLYNAGDNTTRLIDDLGPLGFAGERVWTDPDGRFCGGIPCSIGGVGTPNNSLRETNPVRITRGPKTKRVRIDNNAAYTVRFRTQVNGNPGAWTTLNGGAGQEIGVTGLDNIRLEFDYSDGISWHGLCARDHVTLQPGTYVTVNTTGSLFNRGCSFNFAQGLGGWDLAQACTTQFGAGATPYLVTAAMEHAAAFNWACRKNNVNYGIDVHRLCRDQYGNPSAVADFLDPDNAYSWYCFVP